MAKLACQPLTRSEARIYAKLSALTRQSDPLRFIWQALSSRPIVEGPEPSLWSVPSATKKEVFYMVDIDLRTCTCSGFTFRRRCPHLAVADFAATLRFKFNEEVNHV